MNTEKIAVRTLLRLERPIHEQWDLCAAYDYGFDCGEFSGPSIARNYERKLDALRERIATRFGMTTDELYRAEQEWSYNEVSMYMYR